MDFLVRQLASQTLNSAPGETFNNSTYLDEGAPVETIPPTSYYNGFYDRERDAYEFVAFVLWYLFLIVCCVLPTCCAYRRRRLVESRIAAQRANFDRLRQHNFFVISNMHIYEEAIKEERSQKIAEELQATTFVSSFFSSFPIKKTILD